MNENNYKAYKENIRNLIENEDSFEDIRFDEFKERIESKNELGIMPSSFYRYRVFNENTISEILNQHIFLASPNKFDDIYECKYFYTPFGRHSKNEKKMDWRKQETKKIIDDLNSFYDTSLRIGCLTQTYSNIPMWYYYADRHKGICIKYSTKNLVLDDLFLPVIYPKSREASYFSFFPDEKQRKCSAYLNALIKNESWSFEKEWRLIRYNEDGLPQYVKWPISEIYLGCEASEQIEEVLKKIIKNSGLKIKIHRMKMTSIGLKSEEVVLDEGANK